MSRTPYAGKPQAAWASITRELVAAHPLRASELRDAALVAWTTLWDTTIGAGKASARLSELRVPATIVGYFFEVLLARELAGRYPTLWRGTQSKDEKDLFYIPDPALSVEIKASGQRGFKVFGNRSYGQKSENELLVKKEKSGFYVTVNFHGRTLTLLRFGWIDADDWTSQRASTGQMSALSRAAYEHKLVPIAGEYRQKSPIDVMKGVGASAVESFGKLGISTIAELIAFSGELPPRLMRIKRTNETLLASCYDEA